MEQLASVRPAAEQPKGFFLGLAFGQAADYTALVVNERMGHTPPDHMGVLITAAGSFRKEHVNPTRHVERLPLRTPYLAIVRTVADLVRTPELNSATDEFGGEMRPVLAIDATGVGAPVVDMFREEIEPNNTAWLMPIVITGGHHVTRGGVSKHKLVSRAVKYLQQGQRK